MITKLAAFLLILLAVTAPVGAAQIGGVDLPDTVMAGHTQLRLNGAGLRRKLFFKVYAVGLYLMRKSSDARQIIETEEPMAIRMHFITDGVSSEKLIDAWSEGFNGNSAGDLAAIKTDIEKFNAFFSQEARRDDIYEFIYSPGQGVRVYTKGILKGIITGAAFKKALFAIWLGEKPADENLKQGMLGR
jgi:hypothetical protein